MNINGGKLQGAILNNRLAFQCQKQTCSINSNNYLQNEEEHLSFGAMLKDEHVYLLFELFVAFWSDVLLDANRR